VCQILTDPQSSQNVGWLEGLAGAGRAGADCEVLHGHEETLALHEGEGDVDVAVVAQFLVPVELHVSHPLSNSSDYLIVEPFDVPGVVEHLPLGHLAGLPNAYYKWCRQRARAEATLLTTSIDERSETDSRLTAQVEGTHSLGAVNFVAADAHEVDIHLVDVDVDLSDGLSCVSVQEDAFLPAKLPDLLYILAHSNLVVDQDDTDTQDLLFGVGNSLSQQLHVQDAILLNWQVGDTVAVKLQMPAGVQDALMLNLRCDDVLSLLSVELGQSLEHHVVGLSSA
jgi:hypothetical protein